MGTKDGTLISRSQPFIRIIPLFTITNSYNSRTSEHLVGRDLVVVIERQTASTTATYSRVSGGHSKVASGCHSMITIYPLLDPRGHIHGMNCSMADRNFLTDPIDPVRQIWTYKS